MKKQIITIILLSLLCLYGCDHTDLSGQIIIVNEPSDSHQTIPLVLEVPEDLEEIYKVFWSVTLKDQGEDPLDLIVYGEDLLDFYHEDELLAIFDLEAINYDRVALFKPNLQGIYIIEVQGYYKQTNPQPITRIELTIP